MTVFVTINGELDPYRPAVQIAEWLIETCIRPSKPAEVEAFSEKFKAHYNESDAEKMYKLLVSYEKLVWDMLSVATKAAAESKDAQAEQNRKTAAEKEVEGFFTVLMSLLRNFQDTRREVPLTPRELAKVQAEVAKFEEDEGEGKKKKGAAPKTTKTVVESAHDKLETATKKLATCLAAGKDHADLRLRLMMALYNIFSVTDELRFPLFTAVLDYASKENVFEPLLPYIHLLDSWIEDWGLGPEELRYVYSKLSSQMKRLNKKSAAFDFAKKHANTFQKEPAAVLSQPEAVQAALDLAKDAINSPKVLYFDAILGYDVVKNLRTTHNKKMVELLEIFMTGELKNFTPFLEANQDLFKKHELSIDVCKTKIRMLTLLACCADKTEIPLKDVKDRLQVKADEVEGWVVKAIGQGLVDGRIDQLRQVVVIKSTMQRQFGKPQWAALSSRVEAWQANVHELLTVLRAVKAASNDTTAA